MPLPSTLNDREFDNFVEASAGLTARRVVLYDSAGNALRYADPTTTNAQGGAATPLTALGLHDNASQKFRLWRMAQGLGSGYGGQGAGAVVPHLANAPSGPTFDPAHNNLEGTLLASASRNATTTASPQTNFNGRALLVWLEVTTNPGGAETLHVEVRGYAVSGGAVERIVQGTASAFGGGAGRQLVVVGAAAAETWAAGSGNAQRQTVVPRTWEARVVHSGAGAWTYALYYGVIV